VRSCCWECWVDMEGEGRDQAFDGPGPPPNPPSDGSEGDRSIEKERCFPDILPGISSSRPTSIFTLRSVTGTKGISYSEQS